MRAMVLQAPGTQFPKVAPQADIRTQATAFPLAEANEALTKLRTGQILRAAVLEP